MTAEVELPGGVAHHHGLAQDAMRRDGAPERALVGELPDGTFGSMSGRRPSVFGRAISSRGSATTRSGAET